MTAFNLRKDDPLAEIERAVTDALASLPEARINADEVDLVRASAHRDHQDRSIVITRIGRS